MVALMFTEGLTSTLLWLFTVIPAQVLGGVEGVCMLGMKVESFTVCLPALSLVALSASSDEAYHYL